MKCGMCFRILAPQESGTARNESSLVAATIASILWHGVRMSLRNDSSCRINDKGILEDLGAYPRLQPALGNQIDLSSGICGLLRVRSNVPTRLGAFRLGSLSAICERCQSDGDKSEQLTPRIGCFVPLALPWHSVSSRDGHVKIRPGWDCPQGRRYSGQRAHRGRQDLYRRRLARKPNLTPDRRALVQNSRGLVGGRRFPGI